MADKIEPSGGCSTHPPNGRKIVDIGGNGWWIVVFDIGRCYVNGCREFKAWFTEKNAEWGVQSVQVETA
jgi:hypothetical protein